jgi:hypothetical protein
MRKLSKHAHMLLEYGTRGIQERVAREWAALPHTSLAEKLFGGALRPRLLSDKERAAVSPLGGQAKRKTK